MGSADVLCPPCFLNHDVNIRVDEFYGHVPGEEEARRNKEPQGCFHKVCFQTLFPSGRIDGAFAPKTVQVHSGVHLCGRSLEYLSRQKA